MLYLCIVFLFPSSASSLANHVNMAKIPVSGQFVKDFSNPATGEFVKYGDFITRENLADTLEIIQQQGADAFYRGDLGQSFVQMVGEYG